MKALMKFPTALATGLLVALSACGSETPLDPADFDLSGTWVGDLFSTDPFLQGKIGDLELTLVGEKDGAIEEYQGQGLLTGFRAIRRFQQVQGEYDTASQTVEIGIIDFAILAGLFEGTFDGTFLSIADSALCRCGAILQAAVAR